MAKSARGSKRKSTISGLLAQAVTAILPQNIISDFIPCSQREDNMNIEGRVPRGDE